LGIAQRQVSIKFTQIQRKIPIPKPLPESIKTIGYWIRSKRIERNLSAYHLAGKMGIATVLVYSWEGNIQQPDCQQLKVLASVLGFEAENFGR
jgi:ribosome-binding protein aMBF1 (putative translation factor)